MSQLPNMEAGMAAGATGAGGWTLLDESGCTALSFTSFIDMDMRREGAALSYPVELGSFSNYNKADSPLDLRVTLAAQGTEADFAYMLFRLEEYQKRAVKLSVVTPAALYENMTLKSHSNKRGRDAGAGMLVVDLSLIEVREVQTQVTTTVITRPKNPTSAERANTGMKQSKPADTKTFA